MRLPAGQLRCYIISVTCQIRIGSLPVPERMERSVLTAAFHVVASKRAGRPLIEIVAHAIGGGPASRIILFVCPLFCSICLHFFSLFGDGGSQKWHAQPCQCPQVHLPGSSPIVGWLVVPMRIGDDAIVPRASY